MRLDLITHRYHIKKYIYYCYYNYYEYKLLLIPIWKIFIIIFFQRREWFKMQEDESIKKAITTEAWLINERINEPIGESCYTKIRLLPSLIIVLIKLGTSIKWNFKKRKRVNKVSDHWPGTLNPIPCFCHQRRLLLLPCLTFIIQFPFSIHFSLNYECVEMCVVSVFTALSCQKG